jgi:hypothetical protein
MKTFNDLYVHLLNEKYDDIRTFLKENWVGKEKQESLLRLFAFFKVIHEFNDYDVCYGNFDKNTIEKAKSLIPFLKNNIKDNGDKSDLTLVSKDETTLIATTSKNMKNYNIGDLDVQKIQMIFHEKYSEFAKKICVVIPDKDVLQQKLERCDACNKNISKTLNENHSLFFDHNDLQRWYKTFKMNFIDQYTTVNEIDNKLYGCDKFPLELKFHQAIAVEKTVKLFETENYVLHGHIPRSGKSYIMAGVIDKICDKTKQNNVLIITTAPNETISQYKIIFDTYLQFSDYQVLDMNAETFKKDDLKLGINNIYIASKQFLQNKHYKKPKWLQGVQFSLRFIDETHNGGTTELMTRTLKHYGGISCKTVYMTATYFKPINTFSIPQKSWILWDLEDVKLCQTLDKNQERLVEKHGNLINKYIKLFGKENIPKTYEKYPSLHFMTTRFTDDSKKSITDVIANNCEVADLGWSLNSLFDLKQDATTVIPEFQNEKQMKRFCEALFGKEKNDSLFGIMNTNDIISKIKKIQNAPSVRSRTFSTKKILSVLCFLPYGPGKQIHLVKEAFSEFLSKNNIARNFHVLSLQSGKNVEKQINEAHVYAKNSGYEGLLILSGKQCSMGITLKHCDVVMLLNNTESTDALYQMMFRCMTEDDGKKCGFVVDMNNSRVVSILTDYASKIMPHKDTKTALKYIIEQQLILLNHDEWMNGLFTTSKKTIDQIVKTLYDCWCSNPSNSISQALNSLKFDSTLINDIDRQNLLEWFKKEKESKNKNGKQKNSDMCGSDADLPPGRIKKKLGENDGSDSDEDDDGKEEGVQSNFAGDILKHVFPLACILTIHNTEAVDFMKMCELMMNNPSHKAIFINQLKVWWGDQVPADIIERLSMVFDKYFKNNTDVVNIVARVKELFTSSLNNQKELAKLIDDYIIPQEMEKKKNAEVSTPACLRKDMLDALEKYVPEFFKSQKKVFEPCCGKGQFVLDIVDRFMKGLETVIPDEKERYRTIVEKCLYFADINPTNIYITKLLLDPFDEFVLNCFEGNTLKADINSVFGVNKFDGVIGNPPYNDASGNKGRGHTLWTKFVEIALMSWLKNDGYLLYVHPSLWRQAENTMLKLMTSNAIYYLEIHNAQDGKKIFNCSTRYDWYILQKSTKDIQTKIKCEDGTIVMRHLKDAKFIANKHLDLIDKLCESNDKLQIFRYRGLYGSDKKHVMKEKNDEYIYPLVYTINKHDEKTLYYTNTNKLGQFGKRKFIFSNGAGFYVDDQGEYGVTEWAYCIYEDDVSMLNIFDKVFRKPDFQDVIKAIQLDSSTYNFKIMKYFGKTFYLHFL